MVMVQITLVLLAKKALNFLDVFYILQFPKTIAIDVMKIMDLC